jgi:hypothetical protein
VILSFRILWLVTQQWEEINLYEVMQIIAVFALTEAAKASALEEKRL